jgi:hypothetical protein
MVSFRPRGNVGIEFRLEPAAMQNLEEFRTGQVSLPVNDADDLPQCCFSCYYLFGKEFSVGESVTYLCCGYLLTERNINDPAPPMHNRTSQAI